MTDTQRRSAILDLIDRYTETNTAGPGKARAALLDSGIYTKKGKLRAEFGGGTNKAKRGA